MEECQRLLSVVSGADHLAFRIFIQLGLRSEELFALRRNDVVEDTLRIDEAIVEGASATVKTEASEATVYIPPDLKIEFRCWLERLPTSRRRVRRDAKDSPSIRNSCRPNCDRRPPD